MLMFENGLLASFIPEILMVLGYFFCLFAPNIKEKTLPETNLVCIVQTSPLKSNTSNTLITNSFQLQQSASASDEKSKISSPIYSGSKFSYLNPILRNGVKFSLFSRPPPTLFS